MHLIPDHVQFMLPRWECHSRHLLWSIYICRKSSCLMLPPKFRIVVPRVGYLNWFQNVWLLPTKCMLCNTFPCLQSSNLIGFSPIKSIDNLLVYILVGFVGLFKFELLACNMQKGFELPIHLNVAVWLCLIVFDVITSRKIIKFIIFVCFIWAMNNSINDKKLWWVFPAYACCTYLTGRKLWLQFKFSLFSLMVNLLISSSMIHSKISKNCCEMRNKNEACPTTLPMKSGHRSKLKDLLALYEEI